MRFGILRSGERFMVPVMLVISAAFLATGHTAAGGGFAGGLLAASAFALRHFVRNPSREGDHSSVTERTFLGIGLTLVALVALWPVVMGKPLLESVDTPITLPAEIHIDSSFLFDVGIYLVACGAGLAIIKSLLQRS